MSQEIANIFKAYDIRGLVDEEITPDFTFATGVAFAHFLQQQREPGTVVIAEDMRPSSIPLADAVREVAKRSGETPTESSEDNSHASIGRRGHLRAVPS